MAPFASYLSRLRNAAHAAGDNASRHSLNFTGEQTNVDRRVLDGLLPTVETLIGNSLRHVFDNDKTGSIEVRFTPQASEIKVVISDDAEVSHEKFFQVFVLV